MMMKIAGAPLTKRSDKGFNLLSVRKKLVEVCDLFPQNIDGRHIPKK